MRRRLSYANVAATLALVFSMSGGALAASRYLITSTKQISPKVLKKLKGNTGKTGAAGKEGAPGKEGPAGKEGQPGQSALSPLPAGRSESGEIDQRTDNSATGLYIDQAVTFPIPLPAPIPVSHVVYTTDSSPVAHCSGVGQAEAGYLCIYSGFSAGVDTPPSVYNYDSGVGEEGAGRIGFLIEWKTTGEDGYDAGTYTVTAE